MSTITLAEAQEKLPEVLANLRPGEELDIVEGDRPLARLVRTAEPSASPRIPGSALGKLIILQEDEEHLRDFAEYLP